ncbi:MAG: hypothetical protein JWP05_1366 [Microbacteriaceae bacterium]|nr:hypothetical protein [Microbacteriaceae bacterium]
MDYLVNGLPLHVLLVHFVVIVVPLAALCTVLAAAWPAARRRLGVVTPIIALAALISVPITTAAGEWLLTKVGNAPLILAHAALGRTLLPWAIATFVVATVQWVWFRFGSSRVPGRPARATIAVVLALAVAVISVGSVVTVIQIGESGARAVWSVLFTTTSK